MFSWRYRCGTHDLGPIDQPLWRCPDSDLPLELDGPNDANAIDESATGIRRYAPLLPVDPDRFVTLGAGMTPLVEGELAGRPVLFKFDALLPTGSFKDRGAAVAVAHLAACGIRKVILDSSGNAAAAMAGYAAANDIECIVYAPEAASPGKLVQARAYDATVKTVSGSRDDVARAAQGAARSQTDAFYASHNWSPFFAEGVKTWALEVWEQLGRRAPAAVFVPTGGGSALLGAYRGFQATGQVPRIVAAQPAACAPLVTALDLDAADIMPATIGETIAEGARISNPPRGRLLLDAVRNSHGAGVAVTESELRGALRALWSQGLYVEPTAALGAAAFIRFALDNRLQDDGAHVVLITGSGLKATEAIGELLAG